MSSPQHSVFGVPVTNATMAEALAIVRGMLQERGRAHSIYFVNAHTLNTACDDENYRKVLARGDCVFGDGTGVRWATRLLHQRWLRDNVNGTDLVPRLLGSGVGETSRYFLLGSTPARIERAARFAERTFHGWSLAGYHHGYLNPGDHQSVVDEINRAGAQVLLVGMGNPLQEQWIDRHLKDLNVPVCMGTGGLFDYWSGDLVRAPRWIRSLGHEWVHLLLKQPSKARRYLVGNPLFLMRVASRRWRGEPPS